MGGAEFYYRTKRSLRDVNFGEKNSLLPTFQPVHRAFGDLHSDTINLENSLTSYFTITIPRNHLFLLQEDFVLFCPIADTDSKRFVRSGGVRNENLLRNKVSAVMSVCNEKFVT
jgi:hypothetical protein